MSDTMLLLDRNDDGTYSLLPQNIYPDEPLDSLDNLIEPTKERAKFRVGKKVSMVNVYVENVAGIRYVYLGTSDMRKL